MEKYTKEYYKSINNIELGQAIEVVKSIEELYNPKSVIDLGCGTGLYLAQFKTNKKIGYELSEEAFDDEVRQVDIINMIPIDLRNKIDYPEKFDVAICFEVLEHIDSEYVDILVKNIADSSDIIILTAAPPGQTGLNHLNCQPQRYWDEKFEKLGFKRDYYDEFKLIWDVFQKPHTIWMIRNLMVYKK